MNYSEIKAEIIELYKAGGEKDLLTPALDVILRHLASIEERLDKLESTPIMIPLPPYDIGGIGAQEGSTEFKLGNRFG